MLETKGSTGERRTFRLVRQASYSLLVLVLSGVVLCAAGLGHGIVAALTRNGLIAGSYGAYSHDTVVPALFTALFLGVAAGTALFGASLARASSIHDDWFAIATERIAQTSFFKLAPIVFGVQLLLLFSMESIEQIAAFGHPLGLMVSLGAPLLIALTIHALACLGVLGAVCLAARSIVTAAHALARAMGPAIRRLLIDRPATPNAQRHRLETGALTRRLTPLARRIANRPPPIAVPVA